MAVSSYVGHPGLFYLTEVDQGLAQVVHVLQLPDNDDFDWRPLQSGQWSTAYLWDAYYRLPRHGGRVAVLATLQSVADETALVTVSRSSDAVLSSWGLESLVRRGCASADCMRLYNESLTSTDAYRQIAAVGSLQILEPDSRLGVGAILLGSDDTSVRIATIHQLGLSCTDDVGQLLIPALSIARTPIERAAIGEAVKQCPAGVIDTAYEQWQGEAGSRTALWAAGIVEPEQTLQRFGESL